MTPSRSVPPIVYILLALGLFGAGVYFGPRFLANSRNTGEPSSDPNATLDEESDLLLLGDTFSGYSTFRYPGFQQTLSELDITLNYQDEFDQAQRAARLSQGEADLIVTTLDQFLQQQPEGQIVALIDRTTGADAVVLNSVQYPNLTSLSALKDAPPEGGSWTVTYAGDTPSEYLALVLDTKFEAFALSDLSVMEVLDASEAWDLMQAGEQPIGVAVLWEPFVSQARQQGYTVVLSSEDAPGAIVDVLVASQELIESQSDTLTDLVEAYYRRIDANVRDASQLQDQIAADGGLSPEEAGAVLAGIEFFTAQEAQDWFSDGTLDKRINSTAAVLALTGRLADVPESPTALYTDGFITEAVRNSQTLIDLVRVDQPELADRLSGKTRAIVPTLTATEIQNAPDIGNLEVRGEVQFATGSAQLTEASQQTLAQLTQEIGEFNPQTVAIRVIGHTSRTGSATTNQTLSEQRAQSVVDYFKSAGLQHNILAEGQGFDQPLPNTDPASSVNQRTEIRLVRIETS